MCVFAVLWIGMLTGDDWNDGFAEDRFLKNKTEKFRCSEGEELVFKV